MIRQSRYIQPAPHIQLACVPLIDNVKFEARRTLHHGHTARFELPAIFHCSSESALGHHLTLIAVYDTALFFFFF